MSSSNHYDQNLLGSAQAPTKSQLQEGYNVDLLSEGRPVRSPSHTAGSTTQDIEAGATSVGVSREKAVYRNTQPSFFGSTKGKIIILIAVLVIIGAVVGGAVGGTVHHNNHKASPTTSQGASPTLQGAGGDTTPGGDTTKARVGTDLGARPTFIESSGP